MTNILGNRIKDIRKKKNLTLKDIADAIGKSEGTVQRYESGNISPDNEVVANIAKKLNVLPQYLMGWTDIEAVGTTKVPVLGSIACGEPILSEENIEEYKTLYTDKMIRGNIFYLKAKGDSMSPNVPDGSYVLVRQQEDVENGEIAAVLVNGDEEATLKRVRKIGDNILLEAINEAYDPYIIDENNPGRIIGKAIKVEYDL